MTGKAMALLGLLSLACAPSGNPGELGPAGRETITVETPTGGVMVLDVYRDDGTTTGRVDAPIDAVWEEMAGLYDEIGLPPEDLTGYDPAARRIEAAGVRTRRLAGARLSRFLACGGGLGAPKVDNGQARVTVESWLRRDGDATLVHTRLSGTARDTGTSTAPIRCTSTGRLERELLSRLERRLVDAAGA